MKIGKLQAGAIQLVIGISAIITLLLFTFILLVYTKKQFDIVTDYTIQTVKNCDNAIFSAISNKEFLVENNTIVDESDKSIKVETDFWGVFGKIKSTSKIKSKTFQKVALVGNVQSKTQRTAIYLNDNNKPLVLVGNTKIQGTAYLPKQGVKSGIIAGKSFYGDQLIDGRKRMSQGLPLLSSEMINHLKNTTLILDNKDVVFLDLAKSHTHKNSFLSSLNVIYNSNVLNLSNYTITGHILVVSDKKIIVDSTTKLTDVILIAPKIVIKENTKGVFQAMATEEITVNKNSELSYPSSLVLIETSNQEDLNPKILIETNSTARGIVGFWGLPKQNNFLPQIKIQKDAKIVGEVYCNQNTEVLGSVFGTVFTSNFITKQFGSVYKNHIYNGEIKVDKLPQKFKGLMFSTNQKGIAKWLY